MHVLSYYPSRLLAAAVAAAFAAFATAAIPSAPAVRPTNLLVHAVPAEWAPDEAPPKPWQHSDRDDGISVRRVEHEGASWIELRDDSAEKAANLRQEFPPLKAGRLTFRVALPRDHVGEFGVYLGQGNASAPVERVVEFKTSSRGIVVIGSAGERVNTQLSLSSGMTDHLFLEFSPVGHDLQLRLGRLLPDGTELLLGETTVPQQAHAVTRLRITTDNLPRGARVLVTDLVLSPAS
ncbi:MAG: hypothetical protein H7067_16765, partial [Burkholderiales bacterium]|nr:hypothetical protein [Opitutaceae bacterium]